MIAKKPATFLSPHSVAHYHSCSESDTFGSEQISVLVFSRENGAVSTTFSEAKLNRKIERVWPWRVPLLVVNLSEWSLCARTRPRQLGYKNWKSEINFLGMSFRWRQHRRIAWSAESDGAFRSKGQRSWVHKQRPMICCKVKIWSV